MMAAKTSDARLLKKLKKQVQALQKKEKQGRNKLQIALKKISMLGRGYKAKLVSKVRVMKNKLADAEASAYVKAAADIERHLIKSIETKAKVLKAAINRFEKKSIAKLTKSIAKKGKTKKTHPARAKSAPNKKHVIRSK